MRILKRELLFKIIPLLMVCLVSACVETTVQEINNEELTTLHFIDVEQGDCTLIELPEDKVMLIDAGDNGKESVIIDYIDSLNIKKIDYLIATHPHADHIGGMEEIINKYDIGEIYMPNAETTSKTFENMLDEIDKKNLYINSAYSGKNIFNYSNVKADIISPHKGEEYDNLNNYSVIVKFNCGDVDFLFTGDAEHKIEKQILEEYTDLKCDVLKVGHHGSSSSSYEPFIEELEPEYAIISSGEGNGYGHPHDEVLELLDKTGAEVLRTDKVGTIVVKTNGENINVEN